MATVAGIRELKNRLSQYLQAVKHGRSITITERGEAIAILIPANHDPDVTAMRDLAQRGVGSWKGGKPRGASHRVAIKGKTVSEIILEDRR